MENSNQIYALIPLIMRDIGAIEKGRKNQQQGYQFRGIDDMYVAIQPSLIKHGVFVCPSVTDQKREDRQTKNGGTLIYTILTVKHTFYAPDGSSVEVVTVGEAMDSGDKSANKAMSAAMKYALIEVFSIPTEGDNDTENHSPEVAPRSAVFQQKPNGQPVKQSVQLGTPEELADLKDMLTIVQLPPGTVEKWLTSAKVTRLDDMPADKLKKCIEYVGKRMPVGAASK